MSSISARPTLLAGGTGRLGGILLRLLRADGIPIRVLTRNEVAANRLRSSGVEAIVGDVRSRADTERAAEGCGTVISAISGFGPMGTSTPKNVDRDGNINLVRASVNARVAHFILVSMHGSAPDAPLPLQRMKFAAEQELFRSHLAFTIVRPTACLETYLDAIGAPLAKRGSTVVFGPGTVEVNFVSARDTAALILLALRDPQLQGRTIEWGGPNLTLNQLSEALHAKAGIDGTTRRIPVPVLRAAAVLAAPVSPFTSRAARAAVLMNTTDMSFNAMPGREPFPGLPMTGLAEASV